MAFLAGCMKAAWTVCAYRISQTFVRDAVAAA